MAYVEGDLVAQAARERRFKRMMDMEGQQQLRVLALQQQATADQQQIASLQQQVTAGQQQIVGLQQQVTAGHQQIAGLQAQVDDVRQQLFDAEREKQHLHDHISSVHSQLSAAELEKLTAELKASSSSSGAGPAAP